ncbi:hypothetical protein Pla22_13870 [Rubripirellula amarantea]|uniref:IRE (Iron responsive element) n=1 Tax=Rubripirellula amarantea TaxID=2527999 RepID=A0A5C5WUV7_9BACT|nr:IRE (iron responsive element) [Rubripirellula amarantea]TWT53755.1 hypothetical protein Pla22_13870 [Rubripirellula amarantea]
MNRSTTFRRKIIYIVVLLAMLLPLYKLGQPSSGGANDGGQLSQLRHKYNMAESDLGEISPASETMKLATLGLRGVAATLLWNRAHEYRVLHEWDRLKATLNNIALLQPHFEKVWEHQAHNLAYNVSIEFDDYRQRYEMVREGTEFLTRGVRQNREAPRLIWYTGWFYGAKMGMADEKRQFRRLFSEDEVLHESLMNENIAVDSPEARGPLGTPDNWLVGRLWLNYGYDLVDSGVSINRQTPLNFYETGPKWRFKHAEAIELEGILDDRAQNAWLMAAEDWSKFGNRSIPTTAAFTIKLDRLEDIANRRDETLDKFRDLVGDAYEEGLKPYIQVHTKEVQEMLLKRRSERTEEEQKIADTVDIFFGLNLTDIAKNSDPDVRLRAVQLAEELSNLDARYRKTKGYREQINYAYWKALAAAEQEERTVRARRLTYEAEQANQEAELDKAIELYEEAFAIWEEIFDDYPILTIDDTAEDLFESIRRYMIAIDSEEIPEDFPLREFVELMGRDGRVDSLTYIEVREKAIAKMKERKQELQEEEKQLERELEEANSQDNESDEKASPGEPEKDSVSDPEEEPASEESDAEMASSQSSSPEESANAEPEDADADTTEESQQAEETEDSEPVTLEDAAEAIPASE